MMPAAVLRTLCGPLLVFALTAAHADVRVVSATRNALDHDPVFRVDDVLRHYRASGTPPSANRPIGDAIDFRLLQIDALQGGPLTIELARDGTSMSIDLVDGRELLVVTTIPAATPLEMIDDAWLVAVEKKEFDRALALHADALKAATPTQLPLVYARAAKMHHLRRDWPACRAEVTAARAKVDRPLYRIRMSEFESHCASFSGAWKDARDIQIARIAELDTLAPNSLIHARLSANLAQIESFSDGKAATARMDKAVATALAACGKCRDYGTISNFRGDVYANQNRHEESRVAYQQGVDLARGLNDNAYALASRLRPLARSLRLLGRIDEAKVLLEEALTQIKASGAPPAEQGAFQNALGVVAAFQGDFKTAATRFGEALAMYPPGARSIDAANARHNLGWTYTQAGDLEAGERELRLATEIMSEHDLSANLAIFLGNLTDTLSAQGDHEEAIRIIDRAIELHERVNTESNDMATALIRRAIQRDRLGHRAAAQADWDRAFGILEKLPADNFLLAAPLTEYGFEQLERDEPRIALGTFDRALTLHRTQSKESLAMARTMLGGALASIALDRLPEAEMLLSGALEIRARDVPNTALHAEVLHARGLVARRQGDIPRARTLFCDASDMLDDASLRVGSEALDQARFRATFARIWRDCVITNVELGAGGTALEALERGRARGFRAALEIRQLQLAAPDERAALDALAVNLAGEQEALVRANDATLDVIQRQAGRDRVAELRGARDLLRKRLERLLPSLSAKSQAQLSSGLSKGEAYLAFAVAETRTAVLLLDHTGRIDAYVVPIGTVALEQQVLRLRALIADPSKVQDWQKESDRLQKLLVGPLDRRLARVDTLRISPDGALHNLPFAALWNGDRKRWWNESHAIGIIDALSARESSSIERQPGTNRLLAVGDPLMPAVSAAPALGKELRRSGIDGLRPLPAARREVEQLAARYADRTDVLLGIEATESGVRAKAPKAGQLHFAVHALLDPDRIMDSSLVLAPVSADVSTDDGFLRVHEILGDLRLDADLVVLSACDSGLGKELAGEGLVGFSRAFSFAGARATLATLWPVADESTADLMSDFYTARDEGLDAAHALQQAMRAMASRDNRITAGVERGVGGLSPSGGTTVESTRTAPYYWAAFQVYGE